MILRTHFLSIIHPKGQEVKNQTKLILCFLPFCIYFRQAERFFSMPISITFFLVPSIPNYLINIPKFTT